MKSSTTTYISNNKEKILGAAITVPIIAAGTISGACAGGCPYGAVNCTYPGQCRRYVDGNGNGICDLSVSSASTQSSSSQSSSDSSSQSSGPDNSDSSSYSSNNDNGAVPDTQNVNSDPANATVIPDPGTGSLESGSASVDVTNYHILPITLLLMVGYLFTYYLFKKEILKPTQHKRIWNLLLVGGYLGTGVTGIILTVMINLGLSSVYDAGLTYWHAELSILMVIGTLLHIHVYKKPFMNIFKFLFGFNSNSKKIDENKSFSMSK